MSDPIQIGDWSFSEDDGALTKDGVKKRLESRAAHVLALLNKRRGELVTQAELVDAVWGGRALSRNSVAVVIGDLRRALEDDARAPRYIETVPKRGYRLLQSGQEAAPAPAPPAFAFVRRRPWFAAAAAGAAAIALIAGVSFAARFGAAPTVTVYVEDIVNDTKTGRYDALASAVTEVVVTELDDLPSVRVVSRPSDEVDTRIRGTLVLWDGSESVSLYAEDPRTAAVIWSGLAPGPASSLPAQVRDELQDFQRELDRAD